MLSVLEEKQANMSRSILGTILTEFTFRILILKENPIQIYKVCEHLFHQYQLNYFMQWRWIAWKCKIILKKSKHESPPINIIVTVVYADFMKTYKWDHITKGMHVADLKYKYN